MEIKEQNQVKVSGSNSFKKIESGINDKKLAKLYGMLSGIYKDPIGSIVREYTCNAVDANVEAGKKDSPVIVSILEEGDNYYFTVQDVGVGLSPDRMENVFFNYLESTKEETNDLIGGWGIGAKSALTYTDAFFITTRFDGIEYNWVMSKQSNGIPAGELLYEVPTKESNGTTIKIPVEYKDVSMFKRKCKEQLAYLDTVYFNSIGIANDYTIFEGENYKIRDKDSPSGVIHLVLGDVYYNLDCNEIDRVNVSIPIALKFKVGELMPTPSREEVVYSEESRKLIAEKFDAAIEELKNLHIEQNEAVESFQDYIFKLSRSRNHLQVIIGTMTVDLYGYSYFDDLPQVVYKPFADAGITSDIHLEYLMSEYTFVKEIEGNSTKKVPWNTTWKSFISETSNKPTLFRLTRDTKVKKLKNLYINSETKNGFFYFIAYNKRSLSNYVKILKLTKNELKADSTSWRRKIKIFQAELSKYILSISYSYDNLLVNPTFEANYQEQLKQQRKGKLTEMALNKVISYLSVYGSQYSAYRGKSKISSLINSKSTYIYGTSDDRYRMEKLIGLLGSIPKYKKTGIYVFKGIVLSKPNCKHFEEIDGFYTVSEFIENMSKFKGFTEAVTAYKYRKELIEIDLKDYYWLKFFNSKMYAKWEKLKYYRSRVLHSNIKDSFMEECVTVAEDKGLIDVTVLDDIAEINNYVNKIPLVNFLRFDEITNDEESIWEIAMHIKACGNRVDNKYYLKRENKIKQDDSNKES